MGDTGLLVSHTFDENGIVTEEVYKKLMLDKLEVNMGMMIENIVAQMLTASGHRLYFYSNSDREDKDNRMEIDFLIAKSTITNRHNISPSEIQQELHAFIHPKVHPQIRGAAAHPICSSYQRSENQGWYRIPPAVHDTAAVKLRDLRAFRN